MHDLTVATIHTYYVLAGNTPVLVHNCGGGYDAAGKLHSTKCTCADGGDPRIVRNPNGRAGGPEHQAGIQDVISDIQDRGLVARTEVRVETPGGFMSYRDMDVAAYDPTDFLFENPLEYHQVGLQTATGFPVIRESEAIWDVWSVSDVPVQFHPYGIAS
jgi:hypothetical protein